MRKNLVLTLLIISAMFATTCKNNKSDEMINTYISEKTIKEAIQKLIEINGEIEKFRIEKGVNQVALFWIEEDGNENEFIEFCFENFVSTNMLDTLFGKLERNYEIIYGYSHKMNVALTMPLHLNMGNITSVVMMFGSYSPYAHLEDDFFKSKIAFISLLNFPRYSLEEKNNLGEKWTEKEWAYARLADMFTSRVPASLVQNQSKVTTESDAYISEYNIYVGQLRDDKNIQYFDDEMKLISHWGLRDEIKAQYGQDNALAKQKIIYEVMKRIIHQDIPMQVINQNKYTWNPYSNSLLNTNEKIVSEPNTRYEHLRQNFLAQKSMDKYYPYFPTYIERHFEGDMEMMQSDVESLFIQFVSAPEMKEVAKLVSKRLGRNLEPFDIWYDGFKTRSVISQDDLDKIVQEKYSSVEIFQKEIKQILLNLDFEKSTAEFISSRIIVDDSRGAGHAWGAVMKDDYSRLRTRAGKDGMDYKGFNVAMHELGHTVEQTITLHDVPYYSISGVPNTAFTEALAFMFQKRDMLMLNQKQSGAEMEALDLAWSLYEIMGVSLVDMNLWKWLYNNPDASAENIKKTVIEIAKDIWNKYYAEIFGIKDQVILAIYSHMIDYPLYLSAYPLGHLIEFQLEEAVKDKLFGKEINQIFAYGRKTPNIWMLRNTGNKLSNEYLLRAAAQSVKSLE